MPRCVVVRGITTALALALVILVPAGAGADASRSETTTGSQAREQHALEVLAAVRAAYRPQQRTPGTRLPYRDLTVLLQQLKMTRKDLPASERAEADRYAARAAAGSAGPSINCEAGILNPGVLPTTHFCVHYAIGQENYAQQVGGVLEKVWTVEIGQLGFRVPMSDGDGLLDVYIDEDLGSQGIYGYCATVSSAAQAPAYCALDDDFDPNQYGAPAINSLSVTAAHEFFHAIQFGYNATYSDQASWAMEGSAVWAEDEVYPGINDYLQYLRFSPVAHPWIPVDKNSGYEVYGVVVFWKFLAEYLRDKSVVRKFWEYADAPGGRSSLQAVHATLAARGQSFGPTFARFAAWNTLPAGSYADRSLWPVAPVYSANVLLRTRKARMAARAFDLNHLSSTALRIRPGTRLPKSIRLRLKVNGPSAASAPQALIQVRMRNGTVRYVGFPLNSTGDGYRVVNFNRTRVASVVLTLSNASLNRVDGQRFYASARLVR